MTLGLQRGTVQLQPYDSNWRREFEKESELLVASFGNKILAIEHIGSTSVPGITAKPIIDIIAAVASFDGLEDFIAPLQKLGYEYMPERMFADRKFFPKGPRSQRTHHLSLVVKDDFEQWAKPLLFRDYLRGHAQARDDYIKLKIALAEKYSDNREKYTEGKAEFIQYILLKALEQKYGEEV